MPTPREEPALLAVSDLHVGYPDNRAVVEGLRPGHDDDWLVVAGDVAEGLDDVEEVLRLLRGRFATVVWAPGNHELWARREHPDLRGVAKYERLVERCRGLGVRTPEDPYATWTGPGGPAVVAPLFLLYDYTFLPPGAATKAEGLAYARSTRVVCTDEWALDPAPYAAREDWCAARVAATAARLDRLDPALPTVLVGHWPLVRQPTEVLRHPEFAMWCGTTATADWPTRYRAAAVVYGHLHIPRTTVHDGVRHEEVSLGYPREWSRRPPREGGPVRQILPAPPS